MKIGLVIACINSKSNGGGGHYYSLLETARQLESAHDVVVFSLGNQRPKAFQNIAFKYHHCPFKLNFNRTYKTLKTLLEEESITLIHAFDKVAYLWVRILSWRTQIPSCLTICGGKNLSYFPQANDVILYSKENEIFIKGQRKFKNSRVYVVPNRIQEFPSDHERIRTILNKLPNPKDHFKFLRISRIGKYYHKSSIQLLNLVKRLKNDGVNCYAIFVGNVEDEHYLNELKQQSTGVGFFFTDQEHTTNAKGLIDLSDAVLGTGRSFMEASSKGKSLLSPGSGDIPVLITEVHFKDAFHYNFSERISYNNYDEEENYNLIKDMIQDHKVRHTMEAYSLEVFRSYFDSSSLPTLLKGIYSTSEPSKFAAVDLVLHFLMVYRKALAK